MDAAVVDTADAQVQGETMTFFPSAEVATLRARAADLEAELATRTKANEQLFEHGKTLFEDAARMTWMETMDVEISYLPLNKQWRLVGPEQYTFPSLHGVWFGTTLREAIDAAITASVGGPGPIADGG